MSRSYKKVGIVKDYNKGSKQSSHRVMRANVRHKLNKYEDEDLIIPDERVLFNPYNVCDYKWFSKDEKDKRK